MKKGRHRRFEEARALKRGIDMIPGEPCEECEAPPGRDHASWCRASEEGDFYDDFGQEED